MNPALMAMMKTRRGAINFGAITLHGSASFQTDATYGRFLRVMSTGTGDYATVHASFIRTAYPLTLACWWRAADTTTNPTPLMGMANPASPFDGDYMLISNSSGHLFARSNGNVGADAAGTTTAPVNTINFSAAVFASSSSRKAYFNGVLEATNTTTVTGSISGSTALQIGKYANGIYANPCDIFVMYAIPAALTDDQIVTLMN